jgi:hypothetical protein
MRKDLPDLLNGLFEAGGALMAWRNALQLRRDRAIKGVYWPIYFFYTGWGFWNLLYYPALGQWFSFGAGAVLALGNLAWIWQATLLWRRER